MKDRIISYTIPEPITRKESTVTRSHNMEPMKHLSINVPYPLYNKMVKYALKNKCFLTDVVREGIELRIK